MLALLTMLWGCGRKGRCILGPTSAVILSHETISGPIVAEDNRTRDKALEHSIKPDSSLKTPEGI